MTQEKRVLHVVANLEIGGAQEMVRTVADYLRQLGASVVVCALEDGALRSEIESAGVLVEILPRRRYGVTKPLRWGMELLRLRRELRAIIRKHQIDVVQTHLLRSLDFLVLSLRSRSGPRVFWTFHNSLFDLREDHLADHKWLMRPKRTVHHLLYRLGSSRVDGIVAVSDDVRTAVRETIPGIPSNKVVVVPNCVDLRRYSTNRAVEIRNELGLDASNHLMVHVATFKRQKGHEVLVEALPRVIEMMPHLRVAFVGEGELEVRVAQQVRAKGLNEHVHFLGTRGDIPEILSASDSFVLPSLWEGLAMALIEAMATGLPVIATDVSGTRQVVENQVSGLLVPPGDPAALADAMIAVVGDPGRAFHLGEAARRRVEEGFDARWQASRYLSLYDGSPIGESGTPIGVIE